MAETIISAIVGDAVSRVISHLIGHYCRHQQQSTEAKLQMIRHKLVRIHSAVEEARGKQIANDGTLRWLSELIDAEYQGNYLLDCIKHDLDEGDEDDDAKVVSSLSRFNPAKRARISVCNILSRHHDVTIYEIDRVAERLQGVCDGLREFIMLLGTCQPVRRPLATNIFRHGQMFGRHVDKERIISFLLHDDDDNTRLAVLPVVGDTGVGKTTLAQHACDDARVRSHFQVIMLLEFSYTSAAAAAARSETTFVLRPKHVIGDAAGVDVNVNNALDLVELDFGSKRFLLVFEDVDTSKKQVLEDLLHARTGGSSSKQGSKIIVTTNNRLVATMGTVKPIMLKALPFPEYWFFFRAHAFSGRDLEESPGLVAVGKAIAKKLDGSFFGAKIVGGLLRNNPNPGFWRRVSGSSGIEDMSALGDGVNYALFVWAYLADKPWLKVLLTDLVFEKSTVRWLISHVL
ncbi:disease resistance protein RGA2-like [Miscanthus floridulus]|uniref:disease resistance protein RGA2-like n=1 Tax=Miscanthus floridulus TaxID=154761 RepID=UPI00345799DA